MVRPYHEHSFLTSGTRGNQLNRADIFRDHGAAEEDEPDKFAPVFDLTLTEEMHVEEGEITKFMVKVSGNPKPLIKWFINDTLVVNVSIVDK